MMIQGSGFTLSNINELLVQINRYDPIRGASFIDLPKYLKAKHAIVNVVNNDNKWAMCFKWAILSALYPATSNPSRLSNYLRYGDELDFRGIDFPVCVKDFDKFENQNQTISVNVFIFDDRVQKLQPLRITKEVKRHHIHLLLLIENDTSNETAPPKSHYCWIKYLSRLISAQISNHNGKLFFCDCCLNDFQNLSKLKTHRADCMRQNSYGIEMSDEKNDIIKFVNIKNQVEVPFIIYADLEAILKKPTEKVFNSDSTIAYQEHEVYSIGYYFKCAYDGTKSYYRANRGQNCIDWFIEELYDTAMILSNVYESIIPMNLTRGDEDNFKRFEICHIFEKKLVRTAETIVRDHCHFTGKFRGAAHQDCNLQFRNNRMIPVVFLIHTS